MRPLLSIVALTAALGWAPAEAGPVVTETYWIVAFDVLVAGPGLPGSVATPRLDVTRDVPGTARLAIPWPGITAPASLAIEVELARDASDVAEVIVRTLLDLGAGRAIRASRRLEIGETSSALFEAYGEEDARLVLAIQGERGTRVRPARAVATSSPMRFRLAIERVEGETTIPLETNVLDTFVREPVAYAFRRGQGDAEEDVRVELTPVRITGELVEIRLEISGRMPSASGPVSIDREETLVTSRGATSSVAMVSGEPASGYRFSVTPEF